MINKHIYAKVKYLATPLDNSLGGLTESWMRDAKEMRKMYVSVIKSLYKNKS